MSDSADITQRWHTLLAIDHDAKACEVYRANIPADRVECGEVNDFDPRIGADVILGGPPCQPFSHAGKREGDEDARDCGAVGWHGRAWEYRP